MQWKKDIEWVDAYAARIRPFVFVREEDRLLIKIPNQAYKLNESGLRTLRHLLDGGRVGEILDRAADPESAARDIHVFMQDLQALLKGCAHEAQERKGIETIPFSLPFNTLPVLSEVALTYRCNLKCAFCYAACGCWRREGGEELSTGDVKTILTMIREEAQVPSVSFTGGEPLLRRDLPELVRHAKSLGMWTNLITNGTLADEDRVAGLRSAGLDSAQVSIEGPDARVHDRIVGQPGAFEAAWAGLMRLRGAGIRVHSNTTICGLNRGHLAALLQRLKDAGMERFSMNLVMPVGSAQRSVDQLHVSYREIGPIVRAVQAEALRLGIEFMWYSPTPVCLFNPVPYGLGNKGCAACDGLLSVSPAGDILPCSSYPRPMGNMLKVRGRFRALWHSGEFKYFQQKKFAPSACQGCEHLPMCNGACPLYWQQVGCGELEESRHAPVS